MEDKQDGTQQPESAMEDWQDGSIEDIGQEADGLNAIGLASAEDIPRTGHLFRNAWLWPGRKVPPIVSDALTTKAERLAKHLKWKGGLPEIRGPAKRLFGAKVPRSVIRDVPPMANVLWTGQKGHGKTVCMVHHALIAKYVLGFEIGCIGLNIEGEDYAWPDLDAFFLAIWDRKQQIERDGGLGVKRPLLVLMDEAGLWVDSRRWEQFPDGLWMVMEQQRKFGIWIWLAAPREEPLDIRVRELIDFVWRMRRSEWRGGFIGELWPPMEEITDDMLRPLKKRFFRPRAADFEAYNTYRIMDSPSALIALRQSKKQQTLSECMWSGCDCECSHDAKRLRYSRCKTKQCACVCHLGDAILSSIVKPAALGEDASPTPALPAHLADTGRP